MKEGNTAALAWLSRACPALQRPTLENEGDAFPTWFPRTLQALVRPAGKEGVVYFPGLAGSWEASHERGGTASTV